MVMQRGVELIHKPGPAHTGIGRYVAELERGLASRGIESVHVAVRSPVPRAVAGIAQRGGYDLKTFFATYPMRAETRTGYLTHLTSQTLGGLMFTQRLPRPVVITVHDILPYVLRGDRALNVYRTRAQRLMDTIAMRGLKRADRLVADSQYTKLTLIHALGIEGDRIGVVPLGVDRSRFCPGPVPEDVRKRHNLPDGRPYVLFVGSEDPRKNLKVLFEAFARVRQDVPDAVLLKVGAAAFDDERRANLQFCADLGISGAVRFFDDVTEDDLADFYRLASVFAFPSLYEGFGFPVLEALSCGTPVVAADASSIPEITGRAARLVDGSSISAFAAALVAELSDQRAVDHARESRAAGFTWARTVESTLDAYAKAEATYDVQRRFGKLTHTAYSRRVDR